MRGLTDSEVQSMHQAITRIERAYMFRDAGTAYIANEDLDHGWSENDVHIVENLWIKGVQVGDIAKLIFDRVRKSKKSLKLYFAQLK